MLIVIIYRFLNVYMSSASNIETRRVIDMGTKQYVDD